MKRRSFLTACASVGIGAGIVGYSNVFYKTLAIGKKEGKTASFRYYGQSLEAEWLYDKTTQKYKINPKYKICHSVCLQCHGECGIRAVVERKTNKLVRLMGNPYHPHTLIDPIDEKVPLAETAASAGTLCARGTAGMETAYDPYRITQPIKRVGKRGEKKWKTISWEQLLKEVVEGGKIFSDTTDETSKNMEIKGFQALYNEREKWIDKDNHDLGRVTNKFVIQGGRIVKSRKDFQTRFATSFGTINNYEHTNICELSHHIATGAVYGGKHNFKADLCEAEFVIYWGTAPGEANFPMQTMGKYLAQARVNGCKVTVIDPVLPTTVTQDESMQWLCPKPGTDGAIAMAMIQWIIKNKRYNENFLSNPNQKTAQASGETCHANATHLIIADPKHARYGEFLTPHDIGLGKQKSNVVMTHTKQVALADTALSASIDFSGKVNNIEVKSAFCMMKESANKYTIKEYAKIAGVSVEQIIALAKEFTSHGRKASCEHYRGIAQHPNGYYTAFTIYQLTGVIGNLNWTGGGSLGGGHYDYNDGVYKLTTIPNLKPAVFGMRIGRDQKHYEQSVEYKNKVLQGKNPYPAQRPWFPFAVDIFSEILPSALEKYPYNVDILLWHMCTPFNSTPGQGNKELIQKVIDPKNIPLILASDIVIGDTSQYADYIIPDITFLERHVQQPTFETVLLKGTGVRYPVIEPLTQKTKEGNHICLETFFIDIAKKLGMAGFGENAILDASGKTWALHKMEDYYLKATANIAFNGTPVTNASQEDLYITELSSVKKKHADSLKANEWDKVLSVMSRGGRFEKPTNRRKGKQLFHQYNKLISMYNEDLAKAKHSMTGEHYIGIAAWVPPSTILGKPIFELDKAMPFTILTRKTPLQSHSRLSSNTTIREIMPTNWAEMNYAQGKAMNLKTGDQIWIETVTGKKKCNVKLRQGIAPNVISFAVGFGHTGYGANDFWITDSDTKENKLFSANPIRKAGVNLNPIMRLDPDMWSMSLMDPIGGSACFFDTKARITKA